MSDGKTRRRMNEREWQCFEDGVNWKQERIIKLLEGHRQTTKSVGGLLGVCSCGEAIDDYTEHLIALIKGEK